LIHQYYKRLKDFLKDELFRTRQKTKTLEQLIKTAYKIDNAWYKRGIERKGKYNPDYKQMEEGCSRGYTNNQGQTCNYYNLMELDAIY
jgi:hypothetical protein